MARLLSLNVGLPRAVPWQGKNVSTGIFKEPVSGRLPLRKLNFDGDRQADLKVHGGVDKAVYAYPAEHYAYWHNELPEITMPFSMFGENLTTEGLSEEAVFIGDRFRIGEAELMATQPRLPCYKLGIRFGRPDIIKRFLDSRRTGFYFSVSREGMVGAGDAIELIGRAQEQVSIAEITRLYAFARDDEAGLRRALAIAPLSESWKEYFQHQLDRL